MAGMDRKQVERLIKERIIPKLKPGEKNNVEVKSFNGISVTLLGGALGESYRKEWTQDQLNQYEEYSA